MINIKQIWNIFKNVCLLIFFSSPWDNKQVTFIVEYDIWCSSEQNCYLSHLSYMFLRYRYYLILRFLSKSEDWEKENNLKIYWRNKLRIRVCIVYTISENMPRILFAYQFFQIIQKSPYLVFHLIWVYCGKNVKKLSIEIWHTIY